MMVPPSFLLKEMRGYSTQSSPLIFPHTPLTYWLTHVKGEGGMDSSILVYGTRWMERFGRLSSDVQHQTNITWRFLLQAMDMENILTCLVVWILSESINKQVNQINLDFFYTKLLHIFLIMNISSDQLGHYFQKLLQILPITKISEARMKNPTHGHKVGPFKII